MTQSTEAQSTKAQPPSEEPTAEQGASGSLSDSAVKAVRAKPSAKSGTLPIPVPRPKKAGTPATPKLAGPKPATPKPKIPKPATPKLATPKQKVLKPAAAESDVSAKPEVKTAAVPAPSGKLETSDSSAEKAAAAGESRANTDDAKADDAKADDAKADGAKADDDAKADDGAKADDDAKADDGAKADDDAPPRLSMVEADAVASAIRPSWEVDSGGWVSADAPLEPAAAEPTSPAAVDAEPSIVVAMDQPYQEPAAAAAPAVSYDDEDPVLPVATSPGKIFAALAVVALVGIVGLVWSFSGGDEASTNRAAAAARQGIPANSNEEVTTDDEVATNDEVTTDDEVTTNDEVATNDEVTTDDEVATNDEVTTDDEVAPEAPAAPAEVRLAFRAEPASAQLLLDGQPIPNPYEATVLLDHQQHRLVARLDGYREASQSLGFDQDRSAALSLTAIPPPTPPSMQAASNHSDSTRHASSMHSTMRPHSTMLAHGMRPHGMRAHGMRAHGMRHGAGFTSANPY